MCRDSGSGTVTDLSVGSEFLHYDPWRCRASLRIPTRLSRLIDDLGPASRDIRGRIQIRRDVDQGRGGRNPRRAQRTTINCLYIRG